MTTTPDTAPQYLDKDTYTGRHGRRLRRAKAGTFQARELADTATEGVIWESAGSMGDGTELFVRSRYVANHDGSLFIYRASGSLLIIHPAGRALRILTT